MRFEHPHLLWLLLVVPPALMAFFWWSERTKQKLLTQFVEPRLLAQLTVGLSPTRRKWRYALVIAAAALLLIAIARPQRGFDLEEVRQSGLDIVVAVDTSKSMLATDVPPNRLTRAKLAALELMQTAKADRLGLVAFAGDAFLSCPLTIDDTAFQQSVQALDVNSIPQGGTALASAIDTALGTFKENGNHRALVIFTDGEDNDEGALTAAERAAKEGLKIFTIGVGSAEGTLVMIKDENGNSDYVRDDKGQVVKSKLNEQLLQEIASTAGGFYLPLRGADTINTLYERGLAPLPKSEGKEKVVRRYHEQFHWPLAAAILLLIVEFLLPERTSSRRRQNQVAGATAMIALLLSPTSFAFGSGVQDVLRLTPAPQSVAGVGDFRLSLDGEWQFNPAPAEEFWESAPTDWKPIQVPGEWTMQGFTVASNVASGYARKFTTPADWQGRRVKLRCDAIYSDAVLWINGREAGRHLGGFTPFEVDVTDLLAAGKENRIAIAVKNESLADTLASGSKYAAHPLGGILRKIYLLALPAANISALQTSTHFDAAYRDATLRVELQVANEGTTPVTDAVAAFELIGTDKRPMAITPTRVKLPALAPGTVFNQVIKIPVTAPAQWDPEHPNLYVLNCRLQRAGKIVEKVERRFGFRQVEIRGNQLFINNHAVKLHGVCRHEVHPLLGRSLTPELWRQDAELYAAGNCNYIRTSHYPPAEEFIDACDEVGLLVEEEAPFCWAKSNKDPKVSAYTLAAELAMLQRDRSHPSVIQWSLGNESQWGENFEAAVVPMRELDGTRPLAFEVMGDLKKNPKPPLDIDVAHYPNPRDIQNEFAQHPRPAIAGEYCHLNAYNRREQIADPGLRDVWGFGMARMWETMRTAPGCLGGSIWAAMDDTFFLPDGRTVGYGTWGPLDGWRRLKPEYWHMAKTYSAVRIVETNLVGSAGEKSTRLTVENRSEFANLDEFKFAWTLAGKSGMATASAAPGQSGSFNIPMTSGQDGQILEIRVTDPRGFMVDAYRFTLGGEKMETPPPLRGGGPLKLVQDGKTISVSGNGFEYVFGTDSGQLQSARTGKNVFTLAGPCLTLVPLDRKGGGTQMTGAEPDFKPLWGLCTGWKTASVKAEQNATAVTVKVEGAYEQAQGSYEMTIDNTGRLAVLWKFTSNQALNPRQTGVTFSLPKDCQTLSWRRHGQWAWYPADHIGRTEGTTPAFFQHPFCGLAGPRAQPNWPWSQDQNQYGCNDFRSTKFNIFFAELTNTHHAGLRVVAAGDRHAHAWMDSDNAFLLVANYANDGDDKFFQATRAMADQPIANGDTLFGSALVELATDFSSDKK